MTKSSHVIGSGLPSRSSTITEAPAKPSAQAIAWNAEPAPNGIGRRAPQGGREQRGDEPRTTTRDGRGHTREAAKDEHRAGRLHEHQCRYNRTGPVSTNGPAFTGRSISNSDSTTV